MTAPKYLCANWSPGCTECKEEGKYTCKNCRLVVYCSPACQKSHWTYHKPECKSPLGWETWQPAWVLEGRQPTFIGGGIGVQFGAGKYLWGNVPALDILRLESNEGEDYPGDLHLLFAASGDLRNVIKTVTGLPCTYPHSLDITINDRDFDIVARNLIMLLIALTVEDVNEAVDCIIHIWYSALVRGSEIDILQGLIRPLIEDVCEKIKDKTPGRLLAKTWTFNQCSLRVVLEKSSWTRLLSFVSKPSGLSAEQAHKIRAATTLADSRKDYRDRRMYSLSPLRRIAFNKFRQDGLLLPFGHSRCEFREPNPTLFQNNDNWPMKDSADPLDGWSSEEVAATSSGPASADVYGKLFYYLQGLVRDFLGQLSSLKITFKIFQMDIISLSDHVEDGTLSRIEVSNVADEGWLGIHRTLGLMVPLLQAPLENPHATLILLFLNAVDENLSDQDKLVSLTEQNAVQRLSKYLPPKGRSISPYDPEYAQFYLGLDLVTNFDNIFDRYLNDYKVCELGDLLGAKMKEKHTIIEGWPFRLKLRPGQPGAQDEFNRRMSTGLSGKERYLEWKRVHQGM